MKTEIILACARAFNVPTSRLKGFARDGGAREARFALYSALHQRGHSYSSIGLMLDRHHSTVLHGVREANKLAAQCPDFAAKVAELVALRPKHVYTEELGA
ncbi:MAG: Bacterial dnaA protein helix-turn-helix [Thauera sp.]|nr:helix-turn-helix domain-containing protein [Thauera sp.]MDI3491995.1 Bacterial dnaA protein helix-turn-helix [Thauera sp.]